MNRFQNQTKKYRAFLNKEEIKKVLFQKNSNQSFFKRINKFPIRCQSFIERFLIAKVFSFLKQMSILQYNCEF